MSTPETQPAQRAARMAELGISLLPNGHFTLPPVTITHSNSESQSIRIEVGDVINPPSTTSPNDSGDPNDNQRVMYLQQFLRSFSRPAFSPEASSDVQSTTRNPSEPASEVTPSPQPSHVVQDAPLNGIDPPQRALNGIRGLDFPAFDVSRNGIYNDASQPTGVLRPLEQILSSISSRTQTPSTSAAANSLSSARTLPRLTFPVTSSNGVVQESRNIILTVNYVYGGQQNPTASTTGSLILHVPSINETNQDNIEVLVRLATSIALRTISSTVKHSWGVSKDTFNHLKTKELKDLKDSEKECPICYEKFEEKQSNKRKRDDGNDDNSVDKQENKNKKLKDNDGLAASVLSSDTTENKVKPIVVNPTDYCHYPVELTCGHIFGQSCLAEWFKSSNSCPLCRSKLPAIGGGISSQTTISLPNLATVISNGREVIDDLNHRHLAITIPDEPAAPIPQTFSQSGPSTDNSTSVNHDNVNINNENVMEGDLGGNDDVNDDVNDDEDDDDEEDNDSNGLDALASILRDVYNSVAERFGAQRTTNEETTSTDDNEIMDIRISRDGELQPDVSARPIAGFRFLRNINRDRVNGPPPTGGIFPSGVISQRQRRGGPVETIEINGDDPLENHVNNSEPNPSPDNNAES